MPACTGAIPACMPLSTPHERLRLPLPANDSIRTPLLQDGREFTLQPGMQNGIGALLNRFGAQFSGRRSKQREQLCGFPSKILMSLAGWLVFPLPGLARLRDRLIRAGFILTPDLQ